jgi:undecaprenyl-diphosphatase
LEIIVDKISILGDWGYFLIFLAAFLESAAFFGLFFPGESIVLLAGFLSSHGYLSLPDSIFVIALGAVLGDSAGYSIGRMVGKDYFQRHKRLFLFNKKHMEKTKAYFAVHGGKTIFLGRFIGFLRALAPFVAGMSSMRYGMFVFYNIAGGILWTITFTLLGYFFGESWQQVEKWSGRAGVFFLFMVLVIIGFIILYKKLLAERGTLLIWIRTVIESPGVISFNSMIKFFKVDRGKSQESRREDVVAPVSR